MPLLKVLRNVILLTFVSSAAWAFATGTIWIPNDKTANGGELRLDSRAFFTLDKRPSDTGAQPPFLDEGLTYGIYDGETVGVEGGFDWWEPESQDNLKSLHAHFKFSVHETQSFPGVTLGFYNFGFKANTTDENNLYLGLGKTFGDVGHFFVGYSAGNENVLVDDTGAPANKALFLSYENRALLSALSRTMSFLADFQSSMSQEGTLNFGLKWYLNSGSSFLLGYDIYNDRNLSRDTLNLQIFMRL